MREDHRPRPYSRLNPATGNVEWVTPEEQAGGPRRSSRLETDAEVKARLKAAGHGVYGAWDSKMLDDQLKYWDMRPRLFVDE